jgi:16S rRNA (cytidine1402-2'-O)-methyltransferase
MRDEFASRSKILGEFAIFISGVKNAQLSEESADN